MAVLAAGTPGSLYVHVPFCARKCAYCAFFSEPAGPQLIDRYVAALVRELELVAGDLRPATVFFGGGTPSLLTLRQWETILGAMDRQRLLGAAEWTVECNPESLSLDKARLLRDYGINRISMGLQSLEPALLERLGRIHTRESAFRSFDLLRKAGFDNVNLDLMFAIPGQTLVAWRDTLSEVAAMGPEHLSTYEVTYEEDTPLYAQLETGRVALDEDLACAMYEELVLQATQAGYQQYEVSNFAKDKQEIRSRESKSEVRNPNPSSPIEPPAFACRHNVNYWRGGAFYGLGPSATSYVRGVRSKNWANTQLYCEQLESGRRAIESQEELSPLARAGETAAFGLRMVIGWPFEHFLEVTGFDLREHWSGEMRELVGSGWGEMAGEGFRLTKEGLRFADAVAQKFLR
jgi:oxygen-independent coproporphyrinogen III oxidase